MLESSSWARAGEGRAGAEGPDSGVVVEGPEGRLAADPHLFFPGCSCFLLLWFT